MAPKARIAFTLLFDVHSPDSTVSNLDSLLAQAHDDGARIHSNSYGDDRYRSYTALCRDIDLFTHTFEEDLVVFAVSNGPTVKTPENAKNVLAVGSTYRPPFQDFIVSGGTGPTNDGRRKPEVFAPGELTQSANFFDCETGVNTGTSMACPAVAGGAGLVREYFMRGFYPTGRGSPALSYTPTGAREPCSRRS
jgi:subtilisin family serine protease